MAVYSTDSVYFFVAVGLTLSMQPLGIRGISQYGHSLSYAGQSSTKELPQPQCTGNRIYLHLTRKCYHYQSRGPCPETMRVEIKSNIGAGECSCPINCGKAPMFIWRGDNRCYDIYTQGPCPRGQWLIPMEDKKSTCERNPCLNAFNREPINTDGMVKMFSYGGKCYTNGAVNPDLCPPGERATVSDWKYICHQEELGGGCGSSGMSQDNRCENGYEADQFGGCELSVEIF